MYNLRYHIASLVAVFLSLAIGLLLGTIVVERGTLDRQRDAIVKALQDEFRTIADDNDALRAENEQLRVYARDTLASAVAGRLAGKTVAVLAAPGQQDAAVLVTDDIRLAGGVPVTIALKMPAFGTEDPGALDTVTSIIGTDTPDAVASSVVASLAAEWVSPGAERPLTTAMEIAGAFDISGLEEAAVVDGVVVLAAWEGEPDQDALSLAARVVDAGGIGVGVETQAAPTGVAAAAAEHGLSAIDHADLTDGQYALVYVLAGRGAGYFGLGEGATARYPAVVPE